MNNHMDPAITPPVATNEVAAPPTSSAPHFAAIQASIPPLNTSRKLEFTGNGAEYFRIWLVNLLLTICTLGIYSAWAKVRKVRYFYQNTRLDGHAFDYHGNAKAILYGRFIAILLFAAYTWAFDISPTAGYVTIAILCLAGPWLFLRALQFKLRNTSWRGLRFGFTARTMDAYRALLPIAIIWFSGSIVGVAVNANTVVLGSIALFTMLCLPWMHHRLKSFQHRHFRYGDLGSAFESAFGSFYSIYFKTLAIVVIAGIAAALAAGLVTTLFIALSSSGRAPRLQPFVVSAFVVGVAYLVMSTFAAVRLQRVVWKNTRLGAATFETHVNAFSLAALIFKCVMLGILTAGLYWPFAAIAIARYRIECMEVSAPNSFAETITVGDQGLSSAAGEGALDIFGLDVGL